MSIDWITVSAQVVNFLILVWLLRRFLYRPIMRAMARREQGIAARLEEASQREQAADAAAMGYRERHEQVERERDAILLIAREEAEQQKGDMLEEARAQAIAMRSNWRSEIMQEKEDFLRSLRQQTSDAVQQVARRALGELAGADLEERIVIAFLERLAALDAGTREALVGRHETVRVTTTFELASPLRERVVRAIHDELAGDLAVDFAQSDELLCGIELASGGRRVSWNLAQYMDELRAHLDGAFSPLEPAPGGT